MTIEPVPGWQLYLCSAVGALLLWIKLSVQKREVHSFGDVLERIFPSSPRIRYLSQFIIFVLFGGFIGILLVGPYTQVQAVSAGVAWSRLAAKD
jgi:hypothetical protein